MTATARTPRWTIVAPFLALVVYLVLHGAASTLAAAGLAAALLAAVLAAVHHAEVVAARLFLIVVP